MTMMIVYKLQKDHPTRYTDSDISTIPTQVRDGLVCAVATLVFQRDTDAVAGL